MRKATLLALLAIFSAVLDLRAFNGHLVREGPLSLFIGDGGLITNFSPWTVEVRLTNSGPTALAVRLRAEVIEGCAAQGPTSHRLEIPPHGHGSASFSFVMRTNAYSALYPVHVFAAFQVDGGEKTAHAVRIAETDFAALRETMGREAVPDPVRIPPGGALALTRVKNYQVLWQEFGKDAERLPPGWQGSERRSGASLAIGPVDRGGARNTLQVHPPWRNGPGTFFLEYRLRLPDDPDLRLWFFNAIRDHAASEPPSDGLTFRVWVGEEKLFEGHTASKQWQAGSADLAKFAGKEITLRLESHPGPKQDTTCDSGYWGDPVIGSGKPPTPLSEPDLQARRDRASSAVRTGTAAGDAFLFTLADGWSAAVVPGPNGAPDALIAFGSPAGAVVFDGLRVAIQDQALGAWPSAASVKRASAAREAGGKLAIRHEIATPEGPANLTCEFFADRAGLRVKVSSSARISDLALGAADRPAERVYYGHGYCLVQPGTFQAGGGGHNLSTSHVGFEFDSNTALLMACDTPPDFLRVDPPQRHYSLHTHPDTVFTFVPGRSALACAAAYRPLYDKQPAPAVGRKAGRFVFDIWGGRYADNTARLSRCFDYGLTNSLVIIHDWQRWGYDYRLPDIFPPAPNLGTTADLRELGRVCTEAGALWGLHDNYIDIYPDAAGFGYEHVTFDAEGRPRKAWLNEGRQAQSYQFRPDSVRPFLERNAGLIAPALNPTTSFVDVWTSINAFDYFDRHGRWHSKMETLRCWGEGFDALRKAFNQGPTTSEAGSDQLVGWLDGADCQFLQIGPRGERFQLVIPCRDWERVPWFDLVNHTRFSLHGVGYSDRYQGGRSRDLHGIESDDYLGAEILTGHALMIDYPAGVRGAVRKYWLAQDFIESVAQDNIRAVEFVGGDIHRPHVEWDSGAHVYVNRGNVDWPVAGRVLPPWGYLATNGQAASSVERIRGLVVEQSRGPGRLFFNGRGFNPSAPLQIRPEAVGIEPLGGPSFRLVVNWHADSPAPKNLVAFYHFNRPTPGRYTDTEFYGGGRPEPGTASWKGTVTTGKDWTVTIPPTLPPGEYEVLVGLYDADGNGQRYRLVGSEDPHRRYRVGKLLVEGSQPGGRLEVTGLRFEKGDQPVSDHMVVNAAPADFGPIKTRGAIQLLPDATGMTAVPLPDSEPFEVSLDLSSVPLFPRTVSRVRAVDPRGREGDAIAFRHQAGRLAFTTRKGDFGYRITP